jgi:hypothetical protein
MLLFAVTMDDTFIDKESELNVINKLSNMAGSKPIEVVLFTMNTD